MSDTTPIEPGRQPTEPGRQPSEPPTQAMGTPAEGERYEAPTLRDAAHQPGALGPTGYPSGGGHQPGGYGSAGYPGQEPGRYQPPPPSPYGGAGQPGPYGPPPRRTNPYAIASLVCSLAGVVTGISVIAGIVLGHLALNQIKQTGEEGRSIAIAGLAVGYGLLAIGLLLVVVAVFAFAIILPWTATTGSTTF